MDDGSLSQVGSHQSDSSPLKMIFILFRIIITPLSYVTFADFWVAGMYLSLSLEYQSKAFSFLDQLNSTNLFFPLKAFFYSDQLNSIQPIFPDLYYWYCFYTK